MVQDFRLQFPPRGVLTFIFKKQAPNDRGQTSVGWKAIYIIPKQFQNDHYASMHSLTQPRGSTKQLSSGIVHTVSDTEPRACMQETELIILPHKNSKKKKKKKKKNWFLKSEPGFDGLEVIF